MDRELKEWGKTDLLQIGDRVVETYYSRAGMTGTIVALKEGWEESPRSTKIGVKHDEKLGDFHDLDGHCENNYGYWCPLEYVTLLEE